MLAKWVLVLQPYSNYPITYIRVVQVFHYPDFSEELGGEDGIVTYVRLSSRKLTEILHVIALVHVYMYVHVKGMVACSCCVPQGSLVK